MTNNKVNWLFHSISKEFSLLSSISIGVFLFILFFQPFTLAAVDFNNRLLIIAGFGVIVFLFMVIGRIILPRIVKKATDNKQEAILPSYLRNFITLVLTSVSFAFYLKYIGGINISFYIMFKIVIICLVPAMALRIYDTTNSLKRQNKALESELLHIQHQINNLEEINKQKVIEFISENNAETLSLQVNDVIMINSANNYVEVVYLEEDLVKKKLIRNTLKNVANLINQYSNFMRCHRTCIVNIHYAKSLTKKLNNYWLSLKGYDEPIAVSRQHMMLIREAIPGHRDE